ncbi:MAG: hypothetical protein ORO03_00270, partial [Alphaproteobacteria bacterium]|nr:hypothetical protein [Alphaproteobacteria bacterium]
GIPLALPFNCSILFIPQIRRIIIPRFLKYRIVKTVDTNLVKVAANAADAILGSSDTNLWLAGAGDFVELTDMPSSASGGQWLVTGRSNQTPVGQIQFMARDDAPPGWLWANESYLGNAAAAAYRGDQYRALFLKLWGRGLSQVNTGYEHYVFSSAGSILVKTTATADWTSNCYLPLPRLAGRALAAAGNGSGLTVRNRGVLVGEEAVILADANMPNTFIAFTYYNQQGVVINDRLTSLVIQNTSSAGSSAGMLLQSGVRWDARINGSGQAHNNMPPTAFENAFIRYLE